ncbi:MAG: hypothetical protein WBZ31_04310 [Thiobacillus sp.]
MKPVMGWMQGLEMIGAIESSVPNTPIESSVSNALSAQNVMAEGVETSW